MTDPLLAGAHEIVRRRYGTVEIHTGKGIPNGQRFEFIDKGKRVRCVAKISTGGRISFAKDGKQWKGGLWDADRVLVVAPTKLNGDDYLVSMFDQKVVLGAFNANQQAQEQVKIGHVPNWLAPFSEKNRGARGVGDGFIDKALWSEPLNDVPRKTPNHKTSLTIREAKEALARTFNVSPEGHQNHDRRMTILLELHFVCKHDNNHRRFGNQNYESGSWRIADATADEAIGGRIYLHEMQDQAAWRGGTITGWCRCQDDPERKIFQYHIDDGNFRIRCREGWGREKAILRRE